MNRRAAVYFGFLTIVFFAPLLWGEAFLPIGFLYRTPLWYDPGVALKQFDLFDAVIAFYPYQDLLHQSLSRGEFPFWNPYNFGGHPIAFNGQSGYFYPPRLLLLWLFPTWLAHGLSLALHTFMAGFATWLLARRLGCSPVSALFAGTVWMFNPFVMSWLEMDHIGVCAALTPLALLAVDDCRHSWRGSAWLGLWLGLLLLAGHLQLVLYALATVVMVGTMMLAVRGFSYFVWFRLGVAGFLGFLLSAPMLIPTIYYLSHSQRPQLSLDFLLSSHQKFLQTSWSTVLFPEALGNGNEFAVNRITGAGEFIFPELCFYFGMVTLVMALIAVTSKGLGRSLVVASLLVLVIPSTPLYQLFYLLPGLDRVVSTRSLQIIHFMMALAAGFGLDLIRREGPRRMAAALSSILLLGALAWVWWAVGRDPLTTVQDLLSRDLVRLPKRELFLGQQEYYQAVVQGFQTVYSWQNPAVWLPLVCLGLTVAALWFVKVPQRVLLGLALIDLFVLGLRFNPHYSHHLLFPSNSSVQLIRQAGIERIMGLGSIKPNTTLPLQVQDVGGYDSFYGKDTSEYLAYLMRGEYRPTEQLPAQVFPIKRYRTPLVDLLGVRFLVAYPGQELTGKRLIQAAPLPIFENPDRLPRAFLVDRFRVVEDNGRALELLESGSLDPRTEAILPADPGFSLVQGALGQARITAYGCNEVTLSVDAPAQRLLLLTDGYQEGWKVTVDGHNVPLLRADVMFRGVSVPAGRHTVVFRFEPVGFRAGLLLGFLGILGLMFFSIPRKATEELRQPARLEF